jgi:hypothetical protein
MAKFRALNRLKDAFNLHTLKTSFGAKPNDFQFCPLSHSYVVNVIQPLCYVADVQPLSTHSKSVGST